MRTLGRWLAGLALLQAHAAVADGDLGHKVLGSVGLDAGSQPDPGIYVGNRFFYSQADQLRDRHGHDIPIKGLQLDAYADVVGASGTYKFDAGPYVTAALAVPYAKVTTKADVPAINVDRYGLGDIFVEPLMVGWRLPRADAVASYSFYAPTGQINRQGLGRPQWAQQFSAGGTVFFDDQRALRFSALASYNLYHQKQGIDITRGDTVQIQGGFGGRVFGLVDIGLAGYALWQVGDNQGSDLPAAYRGVREQAVGLGPELGVLIPALKAKLTARYEWDLAAVARPDGQVLVVSLSFLAWR
jgi:hypothetical protein